VSAETARTQLAALLALSGKQLAAARRGDLAALERLAGERGRAQAALAAGDLDALAAAAPGALESARRELVRRDALAQAALRQAMIALERAQQDTEERGRATRGYLKASRPAS